MRRIIIIGAALSVLAGASVALAAGLNTYTAKIPFSPSKAGSAKKPVPVAYTQDYGAASATAGWRAAPLTRLKTTIYGLVANPKPFPTCDGNRISIQKTDSFCPPKALVATGPVNALLGKPDLSQVGAPCNPFLHVWNGGHGKLWFFFITDAAHQCGSLRTGDTQAYPGFISKHGKNLVIDVRQPTYTSTAVAHHPGVYSSLILQKLTFKKLTTKVKGKIVGFTSSVGCKKGSRPWSVAITATTGTRTETKTVSGSTKCSK